MKIYLLEQYLYLARYYWQYRGNISKIILYIYIIKMETNYNINTTNTQPTQNPKIKKPVPYLSNTFYNFSLIGPIIKVIYVITISYIIIVLNDKNKYSNMLYILLFIYAIGCILNSLKYYYTRVHCNQNSAPFLKVTQYANIGYAIIIILFLFYGIFIKK